MLKRLLRFGTVAAFAVALSAAYAAEKPLKVYILVGQSNMQGHAKSSTLPYMAEDPVTQPLLTNIVNKDGKPLIHKNVFISAISGSKGSPTKKEGLLTVGYGGGTTNPDEFGPELGFGITMYEQVKEPILIIKTAWGGKSLCIDFRSPSAGPYDFSDGLGKDYTKERQKAVLKASGHYYRLMMEHIKAVLADPSKVYPGYDKTKGYEIAGFVWFQGWNDMVNSHRYPNRTKPGGYDRYSKLLCHFIRDVRKDLDTPKMPFVIGVMGVGGVATAETEAKVSPRYRGIKPGFQKAMAAPAAIDEFKGNVFAVKTGEFWPTKLAEIDGMQGKIKAQVKNEVKEMEKGVDQTKMSKDEKRAFRRKTKEFSKKRQEALVAKEFTEEDKRIQSLAKSSQGFHYFGCGKTIIQIGEAFAKALTQPN